MNLSRFFLVTSVLVIAFAAFLIFSGVHEFGEVAGSEALELAGAARRAGVRRRVRGALRARRPPRGAARRPPSPRPRRPPSAWRRGPWRSADPSLESTWMRVLLTNDDGIGAEGLHALRRALGGARRRRDPRDRPGLQPQRHRAQHHHALAALGRGGRARRRRRSRYATDGTPVDCVRFADLGLVGERPDLIVSGINHGSNLGDDITYSGTVAAALEGIVLGIPAIAISQQSTRRARWASCRAAGSTSRSRRGSAPSWSRLLADEPLPAGDAAQRQLPGRRAAGDRGHAARQAPLQRRAAAGRRGRRRAPPLPDLRLRALVRGRAGHRPRRGRARADLDHAGALRPHRPRRPRPAARVGPRRRCSATRWRARPTAR